MVLIKWEHFYDAILRHIYREKTDKTELTDIAKGIHKKWKKENFYGTN